MKYIKSNTTIHLTDYSSGRTLCGKIPDYINGWVRITGEGLTSCKACIKKSQHLKPFQKG
jgi:hypothetical protein